MRVEGLDAFTTVVRRKLDMNLSTLSSSQWRPLLVVGLAFLAYLAFARAGHLRRLVEAVPAMRASLIGLAVLAVLGYALNDQGIVIPAVMLAVLVPVLVALLASPPAEASPRLGDGAGARADQRPEAMPRDPSG